MRDVRFLSLMTGLAIAVGGCSQRVAYMSYPTAGSPYASPGVDSVVYGTGGPYVPAPAAAAYRPPYAAPVAPVPAAMASAPAAPPPVAPPPGAPVIAPVSYAGPRYAPVAAVPPVAAAPYALAATANPGEYTLDSGDRLRIVVFGQEGLTNAYLVDAGGLIDMPLIGLVHARGASTDELAARISAKLRDGYIREPHVAVEVEAYRPFFILGEVTAPGQYPYVANMTAETAVAIAGGFSPRAFRRNLIVNRNYNGHPVRMTVPLTFPLRPGDTVSVQERWF